MPHVDDDVTTNGTQLARLIIREKDYFGYNVGSALQKEFWTGELEGFEKSQEIFEHIRVTFGNLCKSKQDLKEQEPKPFLFRAISRRENYEHVKDREF